MRNIFVLADRLHKTPAEIREGFTYHELCLFIAHTQMADEEARR